MIEFEIKNRFSGKVQFTAEIDCSNREIPPVKIGMAVRWGIKNDANLRGADLRGADLRDAYLRGANLVGAYLGDADLGDANLRGADLRGANLVGADLGGADLGGAYLVGADLGGADLGGAYLRGAYLGGADLGGADLGGADLIHCGTRSDGYEFYAHEREGVLWIKAGCRYFTVKDARSHWRKTRAGTPLGDESLQLVKNAVALAKIRGIAQ